MRYARARQTGTQDFSTFIDPGREVKVFAFVLVTPWARPGNCLPQGIQVLEVGILRAAEDVVRAGAFELCTR